MTSPLDIASNPLIMFFSSECFDKAFCSHYVIIIKRQSTLAIEFQNIINSIHGENPNFSQSRGFATMRTMIIK